MRTAAIVTMTVITTSPTRLERNLRIRQSVERRWMAAAIASDFRLSSLSYTEPSVSGPALGRMAAALSASTYKPPA